MTSDEFIAAILKVAKEYGFEPHGSPTFVPDNDMPGGRPALDVLCPNCNARGYWFVWFRNGPKNLYITSCYHCGWKKMEIDIV